MVLKSLRGAIAFLTRIPVGSGEEEWIAFRRSPLTFPLVGYILGVLTAIPFLLGLHAAFTAFLYVVFVYFLTGVNHIDGVADVGDALFADEPRRALKDLDTGAGGVLAVTLVLLGLLLAALSLNSLPPRFVIALVVTSEVGAKLAMSWTICFEDAGYPGLGRQFTRENGVSAFLMPLAVSLPAAFLSWPSIISLVSLATGLLVGVVFTHRLSTIVGGINGDVMGAVNEVARLTALHLGVVAWTL